MGETGRDTGNGRGRTGMKRILPPLLILVLLLAVVGLLAREYRGREKAGPGSSADMQDMTNRTEADITKADLANLDDQKQINQQMEEAMGSFSMNLTPEFPDGTAKGDVRIQNNQGSRFSFTVEIVSSGNGESLLKTGLIDPGHYVDAMALEKTLPAGSYPGVAAVTAYDAKTQQEIGSVGLQVVLVVEQ